MNAAAPPKANKAEDDFLKASKDASTYFERFDKSSLHDAASRRSTDWLLSEEAVIDAPDFFVPMIKGLQEPPDDQGYNVLIPWPKSLVGTKPLYIHDLHQLTWELLDGIFVFNQIPSINFQGNNDGTTSCCIPSAYQDTLIGNTLLSVDYFIKSLLHGTTIPGKDKRSKILEEWKRTSTSRMRERFTQLGLGSMKTDEELNSEMYVEKKRLFIRYPPCFLSQELAQAQLQPRLSTSEDYTRHFDHMGRDMFLRYLDHISIELVFRQKSIQQCGKYLILEPTFDVTTSVIATLRESDPKLYSYLHGYLQKQRDFITKYLQSKRQVAYQIQLLSFVSFMIPFLISLKKQNRIVEVSKLLPRLSKDLLRTERDLPPTLPSKESRWTPYAAENTHCCLHGGVQFHTIPLTIDSSSLSTSDSEILTGSYCSPPSAEELVSCQLAGDLYYSLCLSLERFYLQTPKQPRWVHAMISELRSQSSRQPAITESRVTDLLRKLVGPRQISAVKNLNTLLQMSIKKGLFSAVCVLLKKCTQTRLSKTDDTGMSLLHHAAVNGHSSVVSALILSGSNISQVVSENCIYPRETQSIHLASLSGGLDAVCCLQHYGADLGAKDGNGWAPIHYAAFHNHQSIVTHFVSVDESFLELTTSDKACSNPLMLAAQNGCFDAFKRLCELGATLMTTNSSNLTPVHIVILEQHFELLQYLIAIECSKTKCLIWEVFVEMLSSDSSEHASAVARILDALTRRVGDQVGRVIEYDVVTLLVKLLVKDDNLKLMAIQVLSNLSNLEIIKTAMLKADCIPSVVNLLSSTNDRMQSCTCLVLSDLGSKPENQEAIAKAGALPHLVKLLKSDQDDVQSYACACIGILCRNQPPNQKAVAELAATPILISLLGSHQSCLQGCAANTLQCLIRKNQANQLLALSRGVIPNLVLLLRSKDPPVHNSAAGAIEALAENCKKAQKELMKYSSCLELLKRLLRMRDPTIKTCGGCALWSIAGELISNKRRIASHVGLALLIDMFAVNDERLNYVCSEALGALASELGDNQMQIMQVGGVKPLLDVLSSPSSQRVCLSVIHTLAALCMKPALVPNTEMQRKIANFRGVSILAAIVPSKKVSDIVRVEAACALAKLVLSNKENDSLLARHKDFSYLTVFKFLASSDSSVRLLGGYCLSVMAFNNPQKTEKLKSFGSLHVSNFMPFLESDEEFHQVHAAFQVVVLSRLLTGVRSVDIAVKGLRLLVDLLTSEMESIKVQSAEFIASLAHTKEGVPDTLVMAGVLENLMRSLTTGTGPVIENCAVALGYFTFNPLAARLITGMFRDTPELYDTFKHHFGKIVVSQKFLANWNYITDIGLPSLSLTIRGGPSIATGRKQHPRPASAIEDPLQSCRDRIESQNRGIRFGHDRKANKPFKSDKKVEVGFLVHRKTSLPLQALLPQEELKLKPKRRQTVAGSLGVKATARRSLVLKALT